MKKLLRYLIHYKINILPATHKTFIIGFKFSVDTTTNSLMCIKGVTK